MNDGDGTRRPLSSRNTRWADTVAQKLTTSGIKPNHISLLSFLCACIAGAALLFTKHVGESGQAAFYLLTAVCIQLRLLCNLFDGMVAIEGGFKTKSGELYNETPDRFSDTVIMVCAGYAAPTPDHYFSLGWLAAVLSVITAYVRALGAAAGASQQFVGPMAKQHRMALLTFTFVAMTFLLRFHLSINLVSPVLLVISAGCVITIFRRLYRIAQELESK